MKKIVKVWRSIKGQGRKQLAIPRKELSKRSLGQLSRWKKAKTTANRLTRLSHERVSPQLTFRKLRDLNTDKATSTFARRGKEKLMRKESKTAIDKRRPYFREFWLEEKQIHEHNDKSGFKFRYIDLSRFKRKIVPILKKGKDLRVWAVYVVHLDESEAVAYSQIIYENDTLPYYAFAGELDRANATTYKMLDIAKEGSSEETTILALWREMQDIAVFNIEETFPKGLQAIEFQGFVVSQSDIGKTKPKY